MLRSNLIRFKIKPKLNFNFNSNLQNVTTNTLQLVNECTKPIIVKQEYNKMIEMSMRMNNMKNCYGFSRGKNSQQLLLKKYQKIKQKQKQKQSQTKTIMTSNQVQNGNENDKSIIANQNSSSEQIFPELSLTSAANYKALKVKPQKPQSKKFLKQKQIPSPLPKIKCQGCSVTLQSSNPQKYGYISQKILKQSIQTNKSNINSIYGLKAKQKDAKTLDLLHQVQQQSGIKIFKQNNTELQNLDNLQVMMRLQQKIDEYEQKQQLKNRSKKHRKQLLCFRCFSLKHHNRLPEQYDNNADFNVESTQFILNKIINRHRGSNTNSNSNTDFLLMVDIFDILGTLQPWLLTRLLKQNLRVSIVINKIDVINKQYLNQMAMHLMVKNRIKMYLQQAGYSGKQLQNKIQTVKIFFISCNTRDGVKKLKQYVEANNDNIQLVGFPNTGKTTLLNILARLSKSVSRFPGTTVKVSEHSDPKNAKRKIYDMPGLYSSNLLYNLIAKPSLKSLLTTHKKFAPGLLTNSAFIFGGKIQIPDTRIIVFGLGGACQSSNRWFIDNHTQFWKGLPPFNQLHIKKHQIDIEFINGRTDDLEIAGYGFIGFRLCIPNIKKTTRKLTLYLPEKVQFGFRSTILSINDAIFHNKSAVSKRFMLERLTLSKNQQIKLKNKNKQVQNKQAQSSQASLQPWASVQEQAQVQAQTNKNQQISQNNNQDGQKLKQIPRNS